MLHEGVLADTYIIPEMVDREEDGEHHDNNLWCLKCIQAGVADNDHHLERQYLEALNSQRRCQEILARRVHVTISDGLQRHPHNL